MCPLIYMYIIYAVSIGSVRSGTTTDFSLLLTHAARLRLCGLSFRQFSPSEMSFWMFSDVISDLLVVTPLHLECHQNFFV